ncbi:MAG: flavin reductase family protein [Halobacteriales archaeon]
MVDSDEFRRVMGNFAAGVTVVTLPDPDHGITVNAFASVSLSPMLVLICIDHDTDAYERLEGDADGYCVNLLAGDQRHLGEHFAGMRELDASPFETEATREAPSGSAVFEEALGYIDTTVEAAHEAGDHTVYIGRVEEVDIHRPEAPALTYFRGDWGQVD